jgi:hypothetical protein
MKHERRITARYCVLLVILATQFNISTANADGDFEISIPTRIAAGTYAPVILSGLDFASGWCRFGNFNRPNHPGLFQNPGFLKISNGKVKARILAVRPGLTYLSFYCAAKKESFISSNPNQQAWMDVYISK